MRAALALGVAFLILAGTGSAANWFATDAGTGRDAPGTREEALPIGDGTYLGRADSPKDVDWYSGDSFPDLRCVRAATAGTTLSEMTLTVDGRGFVTPVAEKEVHELAVAMAGAESVLLGFGPTANPAGNIPSRPGYYGFEFARRAFADLGPGDGATGRDAGGQTSSSIPLNGACTAGVLGPGTTDPLDTYHFDGTATDLISISFAELSGTTLFLTLLSSTGVELAEVRSGEVALVELPHTGRYYLGVTETGNASSAFGVGVQVPTSARATGINYIVAFSDDPGSTCRPMCIS